MAEPEYPVLRELETKLKLLWVDTDDVLATQRAIIEVTPDHAYLELPRGRKGDKGDPGNAISFQGIVARTSDLPTGLGAADAAKAWVNTATKALHVWNGNQWFTVNDFAGVDADVQKFSQWFAQAADAARTAREEADRAEYWANETIQQVTGDFATQNYVTGQIESMQDIIRRGAGEVSLTSEDAGRMDTLDSGSYRVTSAFTEVLGMPTNVAGHLHVAWLASSGNAKIHTYTARENYEFRVWARYQGSTGLLDWVPIVGDELAQNHPRVAHAVLAEDNKLLQETRWDGSTYFPRVYGGFVGSGFARLDGELVKTETDMTRMAGWGSSTMAWLEDAFSTIAGTIGAEYFQMGQGSESGDATAARLGSRPALVTFPNNQMPASGSSNITISNVLIHGNPMPFDVTVGGIEGRISLGDNGWIFDRSIPGSAITFQPDTPAVPVIGESLRDAFTVINIGKNSFVSRSGTVQELVDYVTGLTVEAYEHLTPISKRAFVLGHFINANYAPGSDMYLKVQGVNNALKQKFGPVYIDLHEFVTSSRIWTIAGISPTSDDLAHQSRGQLPPSLQLDQAHLNMDGLSAVGVLVFEHMRKHRWA